VTLSADSAGRGRQVCVRAVDVAPYDGAVFCPVCGRNVQESVGPPQIPTDSLLAFDIAERLGETIPVYGFRCVDHRRSELLLPAPISLAPESFVPVDAELDGEVSEVAVPPAVLEDDSL